MINLLGAFLTDVKNGNNLSNTKITGQTLRNYLKSATDCFSLLTGSPLQIYYLDIVPEKRISAPLLAETYFAAMELDPTETKERTVYLSHASYSS
jgi:hypothetical protein